jgi:hypothetical protein
MHRHGAFFVVALLIVTTLSWLVLPHHDLVVATDGGARAKRQSLKEHPLLKEQRDRDYDRDGRRDRQIEHSVSQLAKKVAVSADKETNAVPSIATNVATTMATPAPCSCPFEVHTFYYAW